ncbi:TPA: hypothetical protein ACF1H3_003789 [Salmonella enterica]|uniref:Uncharacterized protein n=1 Tax=Salmonella enterica subsp. enterica serovar Berkeley TaxID=1965103 RepID=A0A636K0W8_SALET|nr:hypothetical protein [Salmonella enterica]EBQ6006625.1 hypothetical protein [Salmonella enterica subsp. enterica serovar Berkeley]EBQ8843811.1 hypothetical protein [Salmonella enterica subsp. enterica serovar Derby]EBR8629600.1 hypothetical protein [Salmonella enterica subsp. enterica serovar Newport]EBX3383795.1 hypothetical protein [Salmonella enterica subsp. enterica serovar Agona]EBX4071347.1 hypothetical protein [Salmonella enterica subsp. enterica serovar Richmond]ECA5218933.1 hypoth
MNIKLPGIDIINALDYRMKCLQSKVAKAIEKIPEESEDLQTLVSNLIEAGEVRVTIKRNATYLVVEENQQ